MARSECTVYNSNYSQMYALGLSAKSLYSPAVYHHVKQVAFSLITQGSRMKTALEMLNIPTQKLNGKLGTISSNERGGGGCRLLLW